MKMNFFTILLVSMGILVTFFISILLAAAITGRDHQAYPVLLPEEQIKVGGHGREVVGLALEYQPRMFLRNETPSPALLWTWYEVIQDSDTVDIVYYQNWEDEVNPNPTIDKLYSVFRAAYYGYPTYDIEYFQVKISRSTGGVVELLYETSPTDDYYVTISEHLISRCIIRDDGFCDQILTTRNGEEISHSSLEVKFDENHVLVLAQTWNHLTRLLSSSDKNVQFLDSNLKYLTKADYSRYKFVRKSQGDNKTQENRWTLPIAVLSTFVFVTLPAILIEYTRRRSGKHKV